MKLFFCKVEGGNFGDDMNEWFWDDLFPQFRELAPDATLFGIGSILWRGNFIGNDRIVVMGSGSGYGVIPNEVPDNTRIGFVRGPRTARLLNLPTDMAVADPAVMVPTFKRFQNPDSTGEVLFIPHVGTAKLPLNWEGIARRAGTKYLSPANESQDIIRRIAGASLVLTESLHGAIIADAFRVPWLPLAISPTFNAHKWLDFSDSLEMEISFHEFLAGMKKTRALVAKIKSAINSRRTNGDAVPTAGGSPHGTHVAPVFSSDDKAAARKWVSRLAPAIEAMLVRDLKKAKKSRGLLSRECTLRNRQSQILDRVDQIRNSLT